MNKIRTYLPLVLFLGYFFTCVTLFVIHPFTLETDLMDAFPSSETPEQKRALKNLSDGYTQKINILFYHDDFDTSRRAAETFAGYLARSDVNVQWRATPYEQTVQDFMDRYHFLFLSDRTRQLLLDKNYGQVAHNALALLYAPVRTNLLRLEQDPFLLAPDFLMNLGLLKTAFTPYKGVLTADADGKKYIYLSIDLDKIRGFSPSYLSSAINAVNGALAETIAQFPGLESNVSGVPLHTNRAISNSIFEMDVISFISVLAIFILCLVIFRSLACFFYIALTLGVSISMALFLTNFVFGSLHVLVLAFGASLIGLCIDYHVHYFTTRPYVPSAVGTISHIKKAIQMSVIIGILGFSVMMLSGAALIQEMAFFAAFGLLNAYVVIRFLYPLVVRADYKPLPAWTLILNLRFCRCVVRLFRKRFFVKIVLIAGISVFGICLLKPDDQIKNLYRPDAALLQREILFGQISGIKSSPVLLIVGGSDAQDVLEKEESLRPFLDGLMTDGDIGSYRALSQIVPSYARQSENIRLVQELYAREFARYAGQIDLSGERQSHAVQMLKNALKTRLSLADLARYPLARPVNALYLDNNGFMSIIVVENAVHKDRLKSFAADKPYLTYHDKLQEMSDQLKSLREKSLAIVIAALSVIALLIWGYSRNFSKMFYLLLPSVLAILVTLGAMGFMGVPITLFHILSVFLIMCFGIDYAIFRLEVRDKIDHSGVAVMIAALTTALSFGLLAFTTFAVTAAIGVTSGLGILLSYLFSPLATLYKGK